MVAEVKHDHYKKDVRHIDTLDVYRIQELWKMHPCAEHVVKKMLVAGGRGHKDLDQDIKDCIDTLQRWQQMRAEDGKVIDAACCDDPGATLKALAGASIEWEHLDKRLRWAAMDAMGGVWAYENEPKWSGISRAWANYGAGDAVKLLLGPAVDIQVAMNSLEQRPT